VLQEGSGCNRGGFGAQDAAAEGYDLHSGRASLIEFFVRPTALGTDYCGHFIGINLY
jgi:hypothetical protein